MHDKCLYLILSLLIFVGTALGEFKVGIILPLTGDAAAVGAAVRNGMLLAYENLPKETQVKLKLIFEDDALKPGNTVSAFRKLVSSEKITAVVNASSGTGNALAPVAELNKVPFIAIATDPAVVKDRKYVVNFWVTAEEEINTAMPEALRRGYKRIARIITTHDFTIAVKKRFDEVNAGRMTVVLDEDYPAEIKDFRPFITKLRNLKDVDAVLVNLMPGQLGIFAKQLRQMDVKLPIFGFETLEDSNEVKVSEGALVGGWYVNSDDPNEKFHNEFKKRFAGSSLYGASNGHDIVLLLAHGAKENMDSETFNNFLHSVKNFSGALGTYSAAADNTFTLPAAVKVVTKEGFEKLEN